MQAYHQPPPAPEDPDSSSPLSGASPAAPIIDPSITPDELAERVALFAKKVISPRAATLDDEERFCPDLARLLADGGFLGCRASRDVSGHNLGLRQYLRVIEEVARVDGSTAAFLASHNSLGVGSIQRFGTPTQKQRYLPQLCRGHLWGFGLSEPHSGSDVRASQTTATLDEQTGEWVIEGQKSWITNAGDPLTLGVTVLAVTGGAQHKKKFSCFLIPTDTEGFHQELIRGKMMWRSTSTAHLTFDQVRVSADALLGNKDRGLAQMMTLLDEGRLSLSALALGLSKEVFNQALAFAQGRHSPSGPLIQNQAISFKLADMALKIATAEALLSSAQAAWETPRLESHQDNHPSDSSPRASSVDHRGASLKASMTKLYTSEVAEFCTREAQQILAARGLIKPHIVERHARDATLLRIGEGTSEIQRMIIARRLSPL